MDDDVVDKVVKLLGEKTNLTPEDVSNDKVVEIIYEEYVASYYRSDDEPLTPESFVDFWAELTIEGRISLVVSAITKA